MTISTSPFDHARRAHAGGRLDEARAGYLAVLDARPNDPDALHLLGVLEFQHGRNTEALRLIERALALRPDFPEALNNRGNVLKASGRLDEAERSYREAIRVRPGYVAAHNHLGLVLWEKKQLDAAELSYRAALGLDPQFAPGWINLGTALHAQKRFDEALNCFRNAVAIAPQLADAYGGLGDVLGALGNVDEALLSYNRSLALRPGHARTLVNRGLLLLSLGRFAEGFPDVEHRKRLPDFVMRPHAAPAWNGESLAGKSILLHAGQGLGDTIQFIRLAAALATTARRVIVQVQPRLVALCSTVADIEVMPLGAPEPTTDYQQSLESLMPLMGLSLQALPMRSRYISADPARVAMWRSRLPRAQGLRVGIAWQGNPQANVDRGRSPPLESFWPLMELPDLQLISLQVRDGLEQLSAFPQAARVFSPGADFDAGADAFVDTAAVMRNLDLVVTSDTSIAHVAGALGVKTWVALQADADWRWLRDRSDSPWYPTMQLFRQTRQGDWSGPFGAIAAALGGHPTVRAA